eukprot:m.94581 g.94581  ORF g.94581 m.94581 type:complete len:375 (-) comp26734_c0_seq1:112-1236(-)
MSIRMTTSRQHCHPWLRDTAGWGEKSNFSTIRTAVIRDRLYVYGRGSRDAHLAMYDTTMSTWTTLKGPPSFSNSAGWGTAEYYETLRMEGIGDNLYIYGRGADTAHLITFNTTTNAWSLLPGHAWLTDAAGWNVKPHFSTIRTAVVGTKLYVCGRGSREVHLAVFDTVSSMWMTLPYHASFSNATGWSEPRYYETLRMDCIGGELYLYGRGSTQAHFITFNTATYTWTNLRSENFLSDEEGWGSPKHYSTVRLAVIGPALYVFGRGISTCVLAKFEHIRAVQFAVDHHNVGHDDINNNDNNDDNSNDNNDNNANPTDTIGMCTICLDQPANFLVVPCGHQCGCRRCLNTLLASHAPCPICRGPMQGTLQVFTCF